MSSTPTADDLSHGQAQFDHAHGRAGADLATRWIETLTAEEFDAVGERWFRDADAEQ